MEQSVISSSSNEDQSSSSDGSNTSFSRELAALLIHHNIPNNFTDSLLKLLIKNGHPDLPYTARTLLSTPRLTNVQKMSGMDYIYFGFTNLVEYIKSLSENEFSLLFNIDGLPLFKSTGDTVWPILCMVRSLHKQKIFVIALACGTSKPADLQFMQDFTDDLKLLVNNPVDCKSIKIDAFICDAPAKAMVKGTMQYSAKKGCDKCETKGVYYKSRMTFPSAVLNNLRTDESFRMKSDKSYHKNETPLTSLPIDMISQFPIDYMHSVCLGVMKKLISAWSKKKTGMTCCMLSAQQLKDIRLKSKHIAKHIPKEISRKPRGFHEAGMWKATEFRTFLLYTGGYLLKNNLPKNRYRHFLKLRVAIGICCSSNLLKSHADFARGLLHDFVEGFSQLYGQEYMTYNVHSLLHSVDDAVYYGNFDLFSAFPFENYLGTLKRSIRKGNCAITQLAHRITERENCAREVSVDIARSSDYSCKPPNNAYLSSDAEKCYELLEKKADGQNFTVREFFNIKPAFRNPCDSRFLSIYKTNLHDSKITVISKSAIGAKCVKLPCNKSHNFSTFQPLLHYL